jgi:hypothetical protein
MARELRLVTMLVLAVAVGTVTVAAALAGDGPLPTEWQDVRAAVAKYHSFKQAEEDGYLLPPGEACVASPAGAMGYHVINPALLADPAIDPLRPEILLYVPKQNGKLELVGVEYWKADADQNLATAGDRPSLFGQPFDGPMPGHTPGMPIHYDVHVWVAEESPSGQFAPFNPALSC